MHTHDNKQWKRSEHYKYKWSMLTPLPTRKHETNPPERRQATQIPWKHCLAGDRWNTSRTSQMTGRQCCRCRCSFITDPACQRHRPVSQLTQSSSTKVWPHHSFGRKAGQTFCHYIATYPPIFVHLLFSSYTHMQIWKSKHIHTHTLACTHMPARTRTRAYTHIHANHSRVNIN